MLKILKLILKRKKKQQQYILRKKNKWLTSSLSIFSYERKYFEMIITKQKCIFNKQKLRFKSSKNQKYYKNYFVKE